ncbi:type II toxin-antitoxin system HicA family toxin [Patescibacteria group bacterium]|nr:type II toxin-antitoxin system HicA family toxin [Patescibacteria group bacterium]MBU4512525.1 type II toxin-antitoxin system HicA family toxin [Patescibacteria group bacterium]MCG2693496.1 type II toxin-antitoxin system HicA family toxin [Candidatus Parcubacteria bacterium]
MSKLPILKDRDLLKVLKRLGFFEHRQRGTSHLVLKHSDNRRVIIAVHQGKDIPRGTLKAILEDAEISVDKLIELLHS